MLDVFGLSDLHTHEVRNGSTGIKGQVKSGNSNSSRNQNTELPLLRQNLLIDWLTGWLVERWREDGAE